MFFVHAQRNTQIPSEHAVNGRVRIWGRPSNGSLDNVRAIFVSKNGPVALATSEGTV